MGKNKVGGSKKHNKTSIISDAFENGISKIRQPSDTVDFFI